MPKPSNTLNVVKYLLEKDPRTRDSDDLLIAIVWYKEAEIKANPALTATEFLRTLSEGKLTSAESLRRCRQKLQELNPALRGIKYAIRHEAADDYRSVTGIKPQIKK